MGNDCQGHRVPLGGDEHIVELMKMAQLYDHTKNTELCTLKGQIWAGNILNGEHLPSFSATLTHKAGEEE